MHEWANCLLAVYLLNDERRDGQTLTGKDIKELMEKKIKFQDIDECRDCMQHVFWYRIP